MLLQYFIILISGDTLYYDVKDDSVRIMCVSLASVYKLLVFVGTI
jgi:hypothetical protein